MQLHHTRFFPLLALATLLSHLPLYAQPAGNPKGSSPPSMQGESQKAPATRNAAPKQATQSNETNAMRSPAARAGHLTTPGSGTAGGLGGRHPQGDSGRSDQTSTPHSIPQQHKP